MRPGLERAALYLGLVRRPGEPHPVFTPKEHTRLALLLALGGVALVAGGVLRLTGQGGLGWALTCFGFVTLLGSSIWSRRLRRRRQARPDGDPQRPLA